MKKRDVLFCTARFIETVQQYMIGAYDEIPENENRLQKEVIDLYYLLGDYYFKNKIMVIRG